MGEYGPVVELAALLVRKAHLAEEVDVGALLEQGPHSPHLASALLAHRWRWHFRWPRYLSLVALFLLNFLEKPRWCWQLPDGVMCHDGTFFMYPCAVLGCRAALALEAVLAVFLAVDFLLWRRVLGPAVFWTARQRLFQAAFLTLMVADAIAAFLHVLPCGTFRISPLVRVPLVITYDIVAVHEFKCIWQARMELAKMIGNLAIFILACAWVGAILFEIHAYEGPWFRDFATSWWSLQVLLTTNNFPDLMIKAYTRNRVYAIFFVFYLCMGFFVGLQMVTSVVYSGYIRQRDANEKRADELSKRLLGDAFDVLDTERRGWLDDGQLGALLTALSDVGGYAMHGADRQTLLFAVLDSHGTGKVDKVEFLDFVGLLHMNLEPLCSPWLQRHAPNCWDAFHGSQLRDWVTSRWGDLVVDTMLCISVLSTLVQSWPLLAGHAGEAELHQTTWEDSADVFFTVFFLLEMLVKLILLGGTRYWREATNQYDALTTLGAAGAAAYVLFPNGYKDYGLVRIAVLFRFFRVLRLIGKLPTFRTLWTAMKAARKGVRKVAPLLAYNVTFFSILGCELFGGLITTNPKVSSSSKLAATDFAEAGYFALNFNDRASGILLLFACLVGNNWDTYVAAFAAVAGDVVARPFFVVWWVLGTLTGLSLLTSVILDGFVNRWGELHSADAVIPKSSSTGDIFVPSMVTGTSTGVVGEWFASGPSSRANVFELLAETPEGPDTDRP